MADLYHYTNPGLVDPSGVTQLSGKVPKQKAGQSKPIPAVIEPLEGTIPAENLPDVSRDEMNSLQIIEASIKTSNSMHGLSNYLESTTFEPVAGYDARKDPALVDAIPAGYEDRVYEARSPEEAQFWLSSVKETAAAQEALSYEGFAGVAGQMAMSLMDPTMLIGGLGAAKATAAAVRAASAAGKVGKVAVGATVGLAEGAAYNEVMMAGGQMSAEDQLIGLAAGAGAGALMGVMTKAAVKRAVDDVPATELDEQMLSTTMEAEDAMRRQAQHMADNPATADVKTVNTDMPPEHPTVVAEREAFEAADSADLVATETFTPIKGQALKKLRKAAARDPKAKAEYDAYLAKAQAHKSAGAAATQGRPQAAPSITSMGEKAQDWAQEIAEHEALDGARIASKMPKLKAIPEALRSQAYRFLTSKSPALRFFATQFLENPSGAVNNRNAAIFKQTIANKLDGKALRSYYDGAKAHAKAVRPGDSVSDQLKKHLAGDYQADYNRLLREELEARGVAASLGQPYQSRLPDYIRKAADDWEAGMEEAAQFMQKYGLVDPEFKPRKGYVPLAWNPGKILQLARDPARLAKAEALLARSYEKMGIPINVGTRIAKAVFQRAIHKGAQIDANIVNLFDSGSTGMLRQLLTEAGVDEGAIGNLLARIGSRFDETGASARTKSRTSVDLNMSDGDVNLMDLVDNDMDVIYRRYTGEMSGRIAMASKGVRSESDWHALRQAIIDDAVRTGEVNNAEVLAKELDGLNDAFMGRGRNGGINRNASRLMESTRLATMGMMGFPQLVEFGNIMGRQGVAAVLKRMPALVGVMTDARMKRSSPLLRELESLVGPSWDDHLLHHPSVRLDNEFGVDGALLKAYDRFTAAGQWALGRVSGLNHVLSIQRRMAVVMEADKLTGFAKGQIDESMKPRMEAMGFEFGPGGNWERIQKQLSKHATVNSRGVLEELNLQNWNAGDAEDFALILQRSVYQQVQGNFIGETPSVLHSTTGALLSQFRAFPIVAMEKQLARQLMIRDSETFWAAMGGLMMGAVVAPVRMTLSGREDEINAGTVAAQAIQYMPMAALLPDAAGMGAALGILPDAAYLRNWGNEQADQPTLANIVAPPSLQYGARVGGAISEAAHRLSPWGENEELTAADLRAMKASTPFGNTVPVSLLFNAIVDEE